MSKSVKPPAETPLTAQQLAALEARARSVSLAAGAGCGKTFVLTERFLAELQPTGAEGAGANLSELVAITFTDAAAREMRDRIRRRCRERMESAANPADADAWQRLLRSIDGARISTIHSLATNLLRQYAVEAGVDPQFTVLDAPAADLVRLETVDDCLRRWLVERDTDVLDLAAATDLGRLRIDLSRLSQPRSRATLTRWRQATADEVVAAWRDYYQSEIAGVVWAQIVSSPHLARLAELCRSECAASDTLRERMANVRKALAMPTESGPAPDLSLFASLRELTIVQGVAGKKHWHNHDDYPPYKDACQALRELLDKAKPKPLDPDACRLAAERGLALARLADGVLAAVDAAKARRGQLEFDDLLLKAYGLLTDPQHDAIRRRVSDATRLVMVDEFQDTNPLQLAIVKAICGADWRERGLFAVGDFKQSIYGFNGAEPEVSTELRRALPPESRLSLTTNFRSQPAILDFVALFVDEFAEYEPLVAARPQTTAGPAIEFLWTPAGDDAEADGEGAEDAEEPALAEDFQGTKVERNRRREARRIAQRLKELLESRAEIVVDSAGDAPRSRPVEPGDVAILFRALSDVQFYEESLREAGLDYYLAGGHAFYAQQEVFDVLNLLRAVDSAVDEIALAGALRSPFFSLADETLFWLAERDGSLNAALARPQPPPNLSPLERGKVLRAARALARLRDERGRLLVAELFSLAVALTGYDAIVSAEFLGERKAANLAKLLEQARALDALAPGDLHGFVTQLGEFVARALKEPLAAAQAEGNVIRLMTIHNAKGLEFPVVVLPDLERKRPSGFSEAVVDERLGPLVSLAEGEKPSGAWIGCDLYRKAEQRREDEERIRLLYVACTRAADYLILSSAVADLDKPAEDWLKLVARRFALDDGTLAAPLPAGYGTPAIRVTPPGGPAGDAEGRGRGPDLDRLVAKTRELVERASPLPRTFELIPVDAGARRRFSFSQLSGHLVPLEEVTEGDLNGDAGPVQTQKRMTRPGAARSKSAATTRGSLVHTILERVDWQRPELAAELADRIAGPDGRESTALVRRFVETSRARELGAAKHVLREIEFILPWPPTAAPADRPAGRYLHGFIDCLYQDAAGAWRVLDYKTNRLGAGGVQELAGRYELQMLVYALAAEQALGEPVAEATLVLLHPGNEHAFKFGDEDRQSGVVRLSMAMDALVAAASAESN